MVSVLKEKLKSGSLVPESEVGKPKERRGVGDGGEREATLIICARNESCGKRVTLNVNRRRRNAQKFTGSSVVGEWRKL